MLAVEAVDAVELVVAVVAAVLLNFHKTKCINNKQCPLLEFTFQDLRRCHLFTTFALAARRRGSCSWALLSLAPASSDCHLS